MVQRYEPKEVENISSYQSDWQIYLKLRNYVTKLNKNQRKLYYNIVIAEKCDNKKHVWNEGNIYPIIY